MARPTLYSQEVAEYICTELCKGRSLRSICRDDGTPSFNTVILWLADGKHQEFLSQYEKARDIQADTLVDDMLDIADDISGDTYEDGKIRIEHVQRSRLRVDTRKWVASKMKPKKYGDRVHQVVTGANEGAIEYKNVGDDELNARIIELLDKAGQAKACGDAGGAEE